MKLLCLITIALVGMPTAAMPRFASERDSAATGTTAARDVSAIEAMPETGGQDLLFPAASLLIASVLAYAFLRQWRRF